MKSNGADDADLEPGLLADLAQRRLLGRLARDGRALGERPGDAVAVAPALADDQLGRAVWNRMTMPPAEVAVACLRRATRGATEERRDPPPGSELVHRIARRAARATAATAAHGLDRQRPPRRASAVSGPTSGRRSTVRRPGAGDERGHGAGRAALPGPGRRVDEARRPGRVACGDAVLHARIVPRHGSPASAVRSRSAASGDSEPRSRGDGRVAREQRAVDRQDVRRTRLQGREVRRDVPASPRVAGPVSAAAMPSARALATVCSRSGR